MGTKKIEITAIIMQKTFIPGDAILPMYTAKKKYAYTRYLIRATNQKFYAWNAYNRHDLAVNGIYRLAGSIKNEGDHLTELTHCRVNPHLMSGGGH